MSINSEKQRCYVCNRTLKEVTSLFGLKKEHSDSFKMMPYKFTKEEGFYDKKGNKVFPFGDYWTLTHFKDKLNTKVKQWYEKREKSLDTEIKVYAYEDYSPRLDNDQAILKYLTEDGVLLDDSQVEIVKIDYTYYLCPICHELFTNM